MKLLTTYKALSYQPHTLNHIQNNAIYELTEEDIGTDLPDLIAYKTSLRVNRSYIGKLVEITTYPDGYQNSRIVSIDWLNKIKEQYHA